MVNQEKADNLNIEDLRSIVFDSIFESRIFTEYLLFEYMLRAGAAKLIIISESLNIIAKNFEIPLGGSITLDYEHLLRFNKNKLLPEYSYNHDTLKMAGSLIDDIESERTHIYKKLSEIMFGGSKAEAAYIDSKGSFDQIVYTMIRNRDYNLVREIYFQVIESKDGFGGFSHRFSAGPEKKTLGVVGPISLNKAHPEIFNRIRTAEIGQLIKPFYVEGWWICIRVENREDSNFTPEIESVIAHQLLDNWLDTLSDDILNKAVGLFVSR